ncbi:hypothetical protein PR202_gb15204 [Eleusine coracana subsp. coracana]|uniref:Uncharacterized protein n=1 Tax=Eleusine coracana subsp. coracana TaxID=191504 RepID=A0AAV5EYA7_ELECO|nr:hypothetical protein QOZ80_4BG0343830 [Eleusine coracana subsp. coracana]GJN27205.1 hypothetical protein PR202_gb15204 [Eleusine coracana subsp. coracana]
MASAMFSYLQSMWPISSLLRAEDDLRASARLLQGLSLPDETKQFVLALREPGGSPRDGGGVIYILAAQNLSEQSAADAERLIREVRPGAVVTQVSRAALEDVRIEEDCLAGDGGGAGGVPVPASPFQVIKRCVTEKRSKDQYIKAAACQVLREVFGIGFYGHLLAAKRAAEETNSCFLLLESPYERNCGGDGSSSRKIGADGESAQQLQASCSFSAVDGNSGLQLPTSCLLPKSVTSVVSSNGRNTCLMDDYGGQLMKSLAPTLSSLMSQAISSNAITECKPSECKPADGYEAPPFAQSVYPLLADLHNIFANIPSIGRAMASAQKLLNQVHEGKPISTEMLSDVYVFRIAIEALRMGLNNAGRCHIDSPNKHDSQKDFSNLDSDEKCHILLVQALRSQLREFGSVVAVVDASCLTGIRRHWNTPVPSEITQLASRCFSHYGDEDNSDQIELSADNTSEKKSWISDKPVVAVGAGSTAILGFSSLSKTVHASAFLKLAPYKSPVILKYALMQLQRHAAIVLSQVLPHGVVSAGSKASALQLTASAEKIRVVTHTVISSAQRTSLMAMRTSFYEIMQKRHLRPFRITPWATFGCSMVACAGLVTHGDGIECAAEAAPAVPMIVSLGRGLESLRLTSQEVRQTKGQNIKEALRALMSNLKKSAK